MVGLRVVEYTLIYFIQVSPVGRSARRVRLSCSGGSCRLPKGGRCKKEHMQYVHAKTQEVVKTFLLSKKNRENCW